MLPLSLLNDFLYCPRRAALKVVEGWREANEHTVLGDIVHEHADLPGYEVAKGIKLLRALPVFSERLGLSGKCDIVEQHSDDSLCPVEYKKGKRRQFENDDAQLCAQALCLEEMFKLPVERGAVFHAESKRRREVEFTPALRQSTLSRHCRTARTVKPSTINIQLSTASGNLQTGLRGVFALQDLLAARHQPAGVAPPRRGTAF